MKIADPISRLASEIARTGGITFAWAVEHHGDHDPLPAAWSACEDTLAMAALLRLCRPARLVEVVEGVFALDDHLRDLSDRGQAEYAWSLLCSELRADRFVKGGYVPGIESDPGTAAALRTAIRRALPVLTLVEVLAATR